MTVPLLLFFFQSTLFRNKPCRSRLKRLDYVAGNHGRSIQVVAMQQNHNDICTAEQVIWRDVSPYIVVLPRQVWYKNDVSSAVCSNSFIDLRESNNLKMDDKLNQEVGNDEPRDQDAPGEGQEEGEEEEEGGHTDEETTSSSSQDEGIEDEQTSYLYLLRDQHAEGRQRLADTRRGLEERRREWGRLTEGRALVFAQIYGNVLRANPERFGVALAAGGAGGADEDGGGQQAGGVESDLRGLCAKFPKLDLSFLARAMVWARSTDIYEEEFARYRRHYPEDLASDLILHLFTFVSVMEYYGLAPDNMPEKPKYER